MVMLVALSNSHVPLSPEDVRGELKAIYPRHFLTTGDDGSFVVEGQQPRMDAIVKSLVPGASGFFMIHSQPCPYADLSKLPSRIPDPALRQLACAQKSWVSVELVHTWASPDDARRFVARAMACLAPPDTAVLIEPRSGSAVAFDGAVRTRLAAGDMVC